MREKGPRWLIWPGITLLIVLALFAAFSIGVYMGERDLTKPSVPPFPEARPTPLPTPTIGVSLQAIDLSVRGCDLEERKSVWAGAEGGIRTRTGFPERF